MWTALKMWLKPVFVHGVSRLIHFSSIHALEQKPLDTPVDETRPLVTSEDHPPYDISKAGGEREVLKGIEKGLNAVIINPTGVIGPYDYYPSHFGEVLLSLACGKFPALVNGGFDWVDARDVAYGAMRAEEVAPRGSKYLLSGHWASMPELAFMLKEILEIDPPRFTCPLMAGRYRCSDGNPSGSGFGETAPFYQGVFGRPSREQEYQPCQSQCRAGLSSAAA